MNKTISLESLVKEENANESGGIDELEEFEKALTNTHKSRMPVKDVIKTKRPIIFICNDAYAKGLKELKKKCIIFNFTKPDKSKLMKRLHEICKKEVKSNGLYGGIYITSCCFTILSFQYAFDHTIPHLNFIKQYF